jgi:hypothetical protein
LTHENNSAARLGCDEVICSRIPGSNRYKSSVTQAQKIAGTRRDPGQAEAEARLEVWETGGIIGGQPHILNSLPKNSTGKTGIADAFF